MKAAALLLSAWIIWGLPEEIEWSDGQRDKLNLAWQAFEGYDSKAQCVAARDGFIKGQKKKAIKADGVTVFWQVECWPVGHRP